MAILGLINTESFSTERNKNYRTRVFYEYPQGASPLLGLLSLMESEVLNDPEFFWYEDRLRTLIQRTAVNGSTSGYWYADSSGALGAALATSAADKAAGTAYWIKVDNYEKFRRNDVLLIKRQAITGGYKDIQVVITDYNGNDVWYYKSGSDYYVRVVPMNTIAAVTNPVSQNNVVITVIGNANKQGQVGASSSSYVLPQQVSNAAGIYRHEFSFTGTALKTSAKFDETGPYADRAHKVLIEHMKNLELSFLFQDYSKSIGSDSLPKFTTGGVLFFLRLWEVGLGSAYCGVTSTYDNTASTANSDDNKRIITINGQLTESDMDDYFERLFRKTNNVANEKLAFVGNGFFLALNKLYKGKSVLQADFPTADSYGMNVVKHVTPFGTIYWKTHKLFNDNPVLRYNALFLDIQMMKYRYVEGRDTDILDNRQANNSDNRTDEWLTEAGLEFIFPESAMFMEGVTSIV